MVTKRFQHEVSTNSVTFFVAALIVTLLWIAGYQADMQQAPASFHSILWEKCFGWIPVAWMKAIFGYIFCAFTGYLLLELHNNHALIRTRTTLIFTVFIIWMGACPELQGLQPGSLLQLFSVITLHALFDSYQETEPVNSICTTFLFIGFGSMIYPKLLYLTPIVYIGMVHFQSFTPRTFFAGLIGLSIPYWFLAGLAFYFQRIELFLAPFRELITFSPIDYTVLGVGQIASFAMMTIIGIIIMVYYMANSYQDRIKIRLFFNHLMTVNVLLAICIVLQPADFNQLFALYLIINSILEAQFFAVTNSKFSNIFFIVFLILLTCIAILNLWNPSLTSY